jgi:hypothetical protein
MKLKQFDMDKKRKEIHLPDQVIMVLEHQAKQEGRNLKNDIEYILNEKAQELRPSKEYMKMMDEMLSGVEEDKVDYVSEKDVRKKYNF